MGAIDAAGKSAKPIETAPPLVADRGGAPGAKGGKVAPGNVCRATTLKPVPVINNAMLISAQTVGIRNKKPATKGYEYLSAGNDVLSLNTNFNLANSSDKLIPYDAVARRNESDSLWVSIAGVGESRGAAVIAKPTRNLRIIVVGAARELSISGLDLVGTELEKQGGGQISLDVEWHGVDETGSIKFRGRYSSLGELVKAAAEQSGGRPLDVLNEAQLATFFDDFEKLLTAQTRLVNRVFWIKGAYAIPSSIPPRFEKFLTAVSSSSAVARSPPSGRPGKWFVLVTARMPGFSVAYLKEPIYSLQIGDLIEESEAGGRAARRLIDDAGLMATRLQISSSAAPTARPGGDQPAARSTPAGRPVIDAKDVFTERGYILSSEAAVALQDHLRRVLNLWDGPAAATDASKQFADKLGKPSPTIMDILQSVDEKTYPRLPKILPDWARKPVQNLTAAESREARSFVENYAAGAERLVKATLGKPRGPKNPNCNLFYVSDKDLGFGKS